MQSKPEGIYFGLSNEEYHNDRAIGCSNIKDLLTSPSDYWWNSPFNPQRESEPTKAMELGTALHCLLMEPKKFEQEYIILPKLEINSNFYKIESQKPNFLQNFALRKAKDAKTFEYIGSKQDISEKDFNHIKTAVDRVKSLSTARELLKSGVSEVSIFWKDKETGLMCKCRHDYLTPWHSVDYKSMADKISKNKINKTIAEYQYYLQDAWYLEGLKRIKEFLIKNNVIAPQGVNQNWWKAFLETEKQDFIFLFQSKKQPFTVRLKTFGEDVREAALNKCKEALEIYVRSYEKYGVDEWKDEEENFIETLTFDDLPAYVQYSLTCQL